MNIADRQIKAQIEGRTDIEVYFRDCGPSFFSLYDQSDEAAVNFFKGGVSSVNRVFFIKPAFQRARALTQEHFEELTNLFTGEQRYNTDPEIIRSELSCDEFFDRYYNGVFAEPKTL